MKLSTSLSAFLAGLLIGGGLINRFTTHRESVEALLILEKAQRTPPEVTYTGASLTRCYSPQRLETRAEVWHKGPDRQRIKFLTGKLAGCIVGCDGSHNWQSNPKIQKVAVTSCRVDEEQASQRFDLLVRNYRVTIDRSDVIAGRPAHVLTIKPKNAGRPWRRIWVDMKTFVILRNDEYGPDDRLKTRTVLEKIDYSPISNDNLFDVPTRTEHSLPSVPTTATRALSAETLKEVYHLSPPQPRYIPSGYELERLYLYRCNRCNCGDEAVLTRYVDGLNTLSVFAVPAEKKTCGDMHKKGVSGDTVDISCCSITGQKHSVEVAKDGKRYAMVVVGEIASSELNRIVHSFR